VPCHGIFRSIVAAAEAMVVLDENDVAGGGRRC